MEKNSKSNVDKSIACIETGIQEVRAMTEAQTGTVTVSGIYVLCLNYLPEKMKEFLKQGAKVALFGSREETVRVALEKLREENPDYPVIGLYPNLMDTNEVKEAFQKSCS